MKVLSSIIHVNTPNAVTLAAINTLELRSWVEIAMLCTSIVCTILVTRWQIRK